MARLHKHKKKTQPRHWRTSLQRLFALLGIAGLIGTAAPTRASILEERSSLEARVDNVRELFRESSGGNTPPDVKDGSVSQWYNWPNWPNWPNWNNWRNWNNWGNWWNG